MSESKLKNSYLCILPSDERYSFEEKKIIIKLFKEIVKEGIIKKGESGSEIIDEIIFVIEEMEKRKDVINLKEELKNENKEFVCFAKEKGFEGKLLENKNRIISDFILTE